MFFRMNQKLFLSFLATLVIAVLGVFPVHAGKMAKSAFLADVTKAAKSKDQKAFEKLFYWEGSSEDMKGKVKKYFIDGVMEGTVDSIQLAPLKPEDRFEYTLNGIRTYPNLKPVGRVQIKFKKGDSGITGTSAFYGQKDGRYYFTVAIQEKVRDDAPVAEQIQINIFGTISPDPVKFKGHFIYLQNDEPVRQDFDDEGRGNLTTIVRGEDVVHFEIRRISDKGKIKVRIQVGEKEVFATGYRRTSRPIIYDRRK